MKELRFYYDIVCPFAYIASTRIETLASRTSSKLIWKPVLLGGIYKETVAPQGAGGSATDVMAPAKKLILAQGTAATLLTVHHCPSINESESTIYLAYTVESVPGTVCLRFMTLETNSGLGDFPFESLMWNSNNLCHFNL
jgi:hypothetical protein